MKKILLTVICLSAFISGIFAQSEFKKYPVKSGIVEYKWEGMSSGTEILYFDNYGYKEARITKITTKMMGMTVPSNTLTIMDGSVQYSINLDDNTGTKMNLDMLEDLDEETDFEDYEELTIKDLGFEHKGQETVCGKTCEVYEGLGKIWLWKGMMIKSETNAMGMNAIVTATSIKTDVSVPADKFKVPDGVEINQEINEDLFDQMMPPESE